jgi:hypothetical protein
MEPRGAKTAKRRNVGPKIGRVQVGKDSVPGPNMIRPAVQQDDGFASDWSGNLVPNIEQWCGNSQFRVVDHELKLRYICQNAPGLIGAKHQSRNALERGLAVDRSIAKLGGPKARDERDVARLDDLLSALGDMRLEREPLLVQSTQFSMPAHSRASM